MSSSANETTSETRWPKVALGIPNTGQIEMETAHCLMSMLTYMVQKYVSKGVLDICLLTIDGTIIPQSRIGIVEEAKRLDATHILWIDSDMTFPRETMEILLSHKQPIVGANYSQRKRPCKPTTADLQSNWLYEEGQTGLEEVKFMGHGVCLVETAIYDAMNEPYYMNEWIPEKRTVMGEDVYFFREAACQLGIFPFVDHDLSAKVTHIGKHHYTNEDALADRAKVIEGEKPKNLESTEVA